MDIKLLALDMDGTTYNWGGTIIKQNIKPIKDALDAGVEVLFVTGRPALSPINQLDKLFEHDGKSIIAACNGACIYDLNKHEIIEDNSIDEVTTKKVFELTQQDKFRNVHIFGYVDDLKTSIDTRIDTLKEVPKIETKFFDGQILPYSQVKNNWHYKFFKIMATNFEKDFVYELQKLNLELAISAREIEINAKGINKAFAVKEIAKKNNISVDNIMAIGDGANDVSMIKYAKYGISIKNSNQMVKDVADLHIDIDFKDGAVGQIIEKYILKK